MHCALLNIFSIISQTVYSCLLIYDTLSINSCHIAMESLISLNAVQCNAAKPWEGDLDIIDFTSSISDDLGWDDRKELFSLKSLTSH